MKHTDQTQYEQCREKTCVRGFPTGAVKPQKMAKEVEGLYYLFSESEDTDQLRCYHAADLRLCFHIGKKTGCLMTQLI